MPGKVTWFSAQWGTGQKLKLGFFALFGVLLSLVPFNPPLPLSPEAMEGIYPQLPAWYKPLFWVSLQTVRHPVALNAVFLGAMAVTLLAALFFRPTGFGVSREFLLVRRPFHCTRLLREQVLSMEKIHRLPGMNVRILASRLLGSWGFFWNRRWGMFRLYAAKKNGCILLKTRDKKHIVIGPAQEDAFLREARSAGFLYEQTKTNAPEDR